jgi:hypothetical protein
MMMNVEQSVEWELAAETEVLGENLPQHQFFRHKSHMTWPGIEHGRRSGKPATNSPSYDTAKYRHTLRIKSIQFNWENRKGK